MYVKYEDKSCAGGGITYHFGNAEATQRKR